MSKTTGQPKFTLIVEWSDEDKCYIGRCPDLFAGGLHGQDRRAVYDELCEAVDEVIEDAEKTGAPLLGGIARKN